MATVTHTFINSTKGTKYPRIKIFHGKKQKVEYIPIKDMRFHQLEDTKKNYLHNEKLLKELTARKNVLAEEINRGTLGVFMNSKKISLVEQIEWTIKHRGNSASTSSKYVSLLKHIIRFLELEGYSIDIKLNKIDFDFGMDFVPFDLAEAVLQPSQLLDQLEGLFVLMDSYYLFLSLFTFLIEVIRTLSVYVLPFIILFL